MSTKLPRPKFAKNYIELHFYDEVYRVYLVVLICRLERFRRFMKEQEAFSEIDTLRPAKGYYIRIDDTNSRTDGNNHCVIWLNHKDTTTLVHELFHFVTKEFDMKGIYLSHDSNEAYAYYMEYWTGKIVKAWNKPKKKK